MKITTKILTLTIATILATMTYSSCKDFEDSSRTGNQEPPMMVDASVDASDAPAMDDDVGLFDASTAAAVSSCFAVAAPSASAPALASASAMPALSASAPKTKTSLKK